MVEYVFESVICELPYKEEEFYSRSFFCPFLLTNLAYRAIDIPCALGNGRVNHFS